MRGMKTILSIALILLAGCAGTPPTQDAAHASTHESADASNQTAADRRFKDEARSYKVVEKNGKKYYCRLERASGSHLKSQLCWTESDLRQRVEAAEAYRRKNRPSVCAPDDPRCGGA